MNNNRKDKFKANEKPIAYNPQMLFERSITKELDELVGYFEKHMKKYDLSLNTTE